MPAEKPGRHAIMNIYSQQFGSRPARKLHNRVPHITIVIVV